MFGFLFDQGKHDPRKMPSYFFGGALGIDYYTAIKADVSKQDLRMYPRYWYVDATFKCPRCDLNFIFTAQDQKFWYEELGAFIDSQAKHCRNCRRELRELKALHQEYDREIAAAMAKSVEIPRKLRLLEVINALDNGGVQLSSKVSERRHILEKQVKRLRRAGAA